MKKIIEAVGMPRLIISTLFIIVLILGSILDMPMQSFISDIIKRVGMYGILVLAMVPSIQSGTGPNFALPIGILCGLLGIVIGQEFGIVGMPGFLAAVMFALPFALTVGFFYGKLKAVLPHPVH